MLDEAVGGFSLENYGFAEDSVADGIARRCGFASFGGWAFRFRSVFAASLEFIFGERAFIHGEYINLQFTRIHFR
jgi:hypothetical protein